MSTLVKIDPSTGRLKSEQTITTSAGAGSAGKVVALDSNGKFNNSAVPEDTNKADLAFRRVTVSRTAYTLELADFLKATFIETTSNSPVEITIPLNSTLDLPSMVPVTVAQRGNGQVTIIGETEDVVIDSSASFTTRQINSPVTLFQLDDDNWFLSGDLEAP